VQFHCTFRVFVRDLEQLLANEKLDPVVRGYLRDRLGRSA
jgi:hypothetical protein